MVRYFTAHVEPDVEDSGNARRQQVYLRALRTNPQIAIHLGRFSTYAKERIVADPSSRRPIPLLPEQRALIIERNEKGSDVNLASYLLMDAFEDKYDLAVVVTNDSDLATPISLVRNVLGKKIAIVNPRKKIARDLQNCADYYRTIRRSWLANAQLPDSITVAAGDITKPVQWSSEK